MATSDSIKGKRILLVDDEPTFCAAFALEFQNIGFHVVTAENGRRALEIIDEFQVDIIITDVRMPEMDGIELLRQVKSNKPEMPIIVLTGGWSGITSSLFLGLGAAAYFTKPFVRGALVDAVMRLLNMQMGPFQSFPNCAVVDLKVSLNLLGQGQKAESRVVSLAPKGCFIALDKNYPEINDVISVKIELNSPEEFIATSGVVRWVSFVAHKWVPTGIGVEFTNLNRPQIDLIANYIKIRP
jgi:CheY-like chemotaxis protein/Tfp pilus assembly protein PilZ